MQLIKYGQKKHPYLSVSILWLMTFCALGRFDIEGVVPFNYLSVIIFAVLAVWKWDQPTYRDRLP